MKLALALLVIILNLNSATAEIMDVGDSSISPIYDYVDFNSSRVTDDELESLRNELEPSREDVQQKNVESQRRDAELEWELKHLKLKCLMENVPSKECKTLLNKG